MTELLEIIAANGQKTGESKDRNQVLIDGDWHASAHLWIMNSEGNLLIQRRSSSKKVFPSMYCAPVSGHIEKGMNAVDTILKESQEEMGVEFNPEELENFAIIRGKFDSELVKEYEFINMFFVKKDINIYELKFDPAEVDSFKYITIKELRNLVDKKDPSLVPAWESYEALLNFLKYNPQ